MIIENKKTGLTYPVTAAQWETMVAKGIDGKFKLLNTGDELPVIEKPEGVRSFKDIVSEAKEAEQNEEFEKALQLYLEAAGIKTTTALEKKIAALQEKE